MRYNIIIRKKIIPVFFIIASLIINFSCIKSAPKIGLSYGAFLRPDGIDFRLYAPSSDSVNLVIFSNPEDSIGTEFSMKHNSNGEWFTFIDSIKAGSIYGYRLFGNKNDSNIVIADPYSKAAITQNKWKHIAKSLVIDSDFNWEGDTWKTINPRNLIIYEAHLRDMTVHPSSGVKSRGTYLGFIENKQVGGLEHLKSLGVNAVQFLPLWDFANFEIPYKRQADKFYNDWNPYERNHWGYMPTFFFAPETYYSTEGTDTPEAWNGKTGKAVNELKELVKTLHHNDIAVIMDVVVNHVSNYDYNPLKYIDRDLYFEMDEHGNYISQCCGNVLDTDEPVVRDYIIESLIYWMTEYHIDGFRFDQAHLISIETAQIILERLRNINPRVYIYGEAWDNKGAQFSEIGWGSFNAHFRDVLRGDLWDYSKKGFLFGSYRPNESKDELVNIVSGTNLGPKGIYKAPEHAINFLEVHDDYCFSDYLRLSYGRNKPDDIIIDKLEHIKLSSEILRMNTLGATVLFTSLGIPLIHQGQEWGHTQVIAETNYPDENVGKMDRNPYNKDNETNWVDWNELKQNQVLFDYYKGLIKIRKKYSQLRNSSVTLIEFLDLENEFGLGYIYDNSLAIYLNGDPNNSISIKLLDGKWLQLSNSTQVDINGIRVAEGYVNIPPTSGAIFVKEI